ncbi:MAG TPA: restriction endonuclease [Terracidiphilus sp.]|jgi:restriction system protein
MAYPGKPGVRRFEKVVRFATIGPIKAGWLAKNKGKWIPHHDGKLAFKQYSDPEQFMKRARELYYVWKSAQPDGDELLEDEVSESVHTTLEEAEELAWTEIEKYMQNIQPFDLQTLVAALLKGMGYLVSWISPPGLDQGIDILAHTDPLGTQNPRIKVQVKRRADAVDVAGLRSSLAVLGDGDVGIFVCTGGFTSAADLEARMLEKRKITLVGIERLFDPGFSIPTRSTEPKSVFCL